MLSQYYVLNEQILFVVLVVMLGIFLLGPSAMSYKIHRSTTISFGMFSIALLCLLTEYALMHITIGLSEYAKNIIHPFYHIGLSMITDLASICILTAAIAYRRGANFELGLAIIYSSWALAALFLWYVGFELFDYRTDLTATVIRLSPGIVIAVVAMVTLGWSFFIRWGALAGGPLLFVCVGYAAFQLPATLSGELAEFFGSPAATTLLGLSTDMTNPAGVAKIIAEQIISDSAVIFRILAGGKILLAFGFLSLLCASTLPAVKINESRDWFGPRLRPPEWIGWASICSVVAAALTSIWGEVIAALTAKLTQRLLGYS